MDRITRAPHAQPVNAMIKPFMYGVELLTYDSMIMRSAKPGMTKKMLQMALRIESVTPPRYPAVTPMSTAIIVLSTPAPMPTISVARVPQINCENTSCPRLVVPKIWLAEGGCNMLKFVDEGLYGAINGANIAMTTNNPKRITPTSDLGFLKNVCSAEFLRFAFCFGVLAVVLTATLCVLTTLHLSFLRADPNVRTTYRR